MHAYRIADAARLLGVSDDTVRRWIEAGSLATTGASPAEIPGDALAQRAHLCAKFRTLQHATRDARRAPMGVSQRALLVSYFFDGQDDDY